MVDHSQKLHDGSNSRKVNIGSSNGIAAIANKLDRAHLDKECLLHGDVKSIEEVKYGKFGQSFQNNSKNSTRYRVGPPGYYTRMDDRPLSSERKPILTEMITKYIEESAKKEAEHDEWLRKFQENTKLNQKRECKAIFTKDGLPLYTPFFYSPEEVEYFSTNSSFSDEETHEEIKEVEEIGEAVAHREPAPREVTRSELPIVSNYVAPCKPSILFPRRLEQHAEEALVYKTMESLKRIKVNHPLLKEIRQTYDYAKYIKNLVVNKPRTSKNKDVKMNPRCSTILQNQLPPKEQDLGSFNLPCSIGKLNFSNALADLGASVSIMPCSMFKRFCDIRYGRRFRMPIILGRPLLVMAHAKVDFLRKLISLEVRNEKESQEEIDYRCSMLDQGEPQEIETFVEPNRKHDMDLSSGYFPDNTKKKCYWGCLNDDKRLNVAWEGMSFKDWVRVSHGKEENTNTEEDCKDLENFGEKKMELILDVVLDKLDVDWFTRTINGEDDLDGIVDY
ncbi:hypothetical protein Tco_0881477 [Tanacetum coccineum]